MKRLASAAVTSVARRSKSSPAVTATCPYDAGFAEARPYEEVPGPKPLPIIGKNKINLYIISQYIRK